MRRMLTIAAAVGLALTGCSSNPSQPAAAPTSQAQASTTASQPPTTCNLKSQGDIIERVVDPGQPATAQELGSIDLENCVTAFSEIAKETSTDPGFCSQEAWASDNPHYDVNAVPAAPLKKVQAQAGAGCAQG